MHEHWLMTGPHSFQSMFSDLVVISMIRTRCRVPLGRVLLVLYQMDCKSSSGHYLGCTQRHGNLLTSSSFFRMTSTSSSGGNVINFSDRFTITGLTGITDPTYRNAAAALNGDTRGPPREGNVPAITSSSSASTRPTNSRSSTGSQQTVTVTTGGGSHPTVRFSLTNPNHNSGPDTGVIVGAVVACIAFLFAIIGIGIWIFIRRKRRCVGAAHLDDKDELGKQPSVSVTALSELSAEGRVVEMGNGVPPPEMDSNSVRAELEGDCGYEPSEMLGTPVGTLSPLTPIAPSISEETLGSPTSPASGV